MIEFLQHLFTLKNRYFIYKMKVDSEGKLNHVGFVPSEREDMLPDSKDARIHIPYSFEVQVNIDDEPVQGSHGNRRFWMCSSYRAVFRDFQTESLHNGEKLVIRLEDPESRLWIRLVYILYEDSPALVRRTEIENCSDRDIVLQHVSGFMLSNFPYATSSTGNSQMFLHRYKSQWSWEGTHESASFDSLGLYSHWCRNGYAIESSSSMPCLSYLPYFVVEDRANNLYWGIQHEFSGPWRFEAGTADIGLDNWFYLQGGIGNSLHAQWENPLRPGEVFITPPSSLVAATGCLEEVYDQMHLHQRTALIHRSEADRTLPVIYNDWQFMFGQVSESRVIEQLDRLADLGIECYVMDAGWFTASDPANPCSSWWDAAGDWEADSERFPHGLAYLAGEISRRGMIPGIWCEIEAAGRCSALFHREELLMKRGSRFAEDTNRRFLYFGSDAGRRYARSTFERLIGYGFRYFKIDYNIDSAPGCTNSGGTPGQGLYEHRIGYYRWLEELRRDHPDVIIENCASGGMRLEYGMLSRTDLASITDQESFHYTGSILANLVRLIHPSQCGNWSALKVCMNPEEYAFTLTNSMMGRMHISGDIVHHDALRQELIREALRFYRSCRHILDNPLIRFYTKVPAYEENNGFLVWEYRTRDNCESLVCIMKLQHSGENRFQMRWPDLLPGNYEINVFPDCHRKMLFSESAWSSGIPSDDLKRHGALVEWSGSFRSVIVHLHRMNV